MHGKKYLGVFAVKVKHMWNNHFIGFVCAVIKKIYNRNIEFFLNFSEKGG
jgi:hypothetical protein